MSSPLLAASRAVSDTSKGESSMGMTRKIALVVVGIGGLVLLGWLAFNWRCGFGRFCEPRWPDDLFAGFAPAAPGGPGGGVGVPVVLPATCGLPCDEAVGATCADGLTCVSGVCMGEACEYGCGTSCRSWGESPEDCSALGSGFECTQGPGTGEVCWNTDLCGTAPSRGVCGTACDPEAPFHQCGNGRECIATADGQNVCWDDACGPEPASFALCGADCDPASPNCGAGLECLLNESSGGYRCAIPGVANGCWPVDVPGLACGVACDPLNGCVSGLNCTAGTTSNAACTHPIQCLPEGPELPSGAGPVVSTIPPVSMSTPIAGSVAPACGSPCTSAEQCAGLGPNPACAGGFCYDAQTCGGGTSGGSDSGGTDSGGGTPGGSDPCANSCGNGVCEANCKEDSWTCSADCGPA